MNWAVLLIVLSLTSSRFVEASEQWLSAAMVVSQNMSLSFDHMREQLNAVARQMQLQQFYTEMRVRTEGSSGLKQLRNRILGTKNYYEATHISGSVAAIHEHANNIRTVGMGELDVVMNGVEFRTRHNDYRLYKAHNTSAEYYKTENVPFPDVPPEVLEIPDVDGQIVEMREWFKAFRDQDHSRRDYRKYFKPVLTYLEGSWTYSGKNFEEGITSDRHFTDAKSWHELQMKNIFASASGGKSRLENLAFLPTTVTGFDGNIPKFAQWNYRILCHPLENDLPLNRLRVIDDLSSRLRRKYTIHQHEHSRSARFQINHKDEDVWGKDFGDSESGLLDKLMGEIPGVDNYQGKIEGKDLDGNIILGMDGKPQDMSRYHRRYKVSGKDAMGQTKILRGFSDPNMFAAMTEQEKVPEVEIEKCKWRKCETIKQRWTYAIPLEIIYLTPLSNWNPYSIAYKGSDSRSDEYKSVTENNNRNGVCNDDDSKAFNGSHSRLYYRTPAEFYNGLEVNRDAADTSRSTVCALDQTGKARRVRSAGTRIFLPNIPGVGVLRQRYPIMPVHFEGHPLAKEFSALKDLVMNPELHKKYSSHSTAMETSEDHEFQSGMSRTDPHSHTIILTAHEYGQLLGGRSITKTTSTASGHEHSMILKWHQDKGYMYYDRCDGRRRCLDKHDKKFTTGETEDELNSTK